MVSSLLLALKVSTSISLVLSLMLTSDFLTLFQSLKKIGVPKFVIFLLYTTLIYINVFIREALKLLLARRSRWINGSYKQFLSSFATIIGVLILRAFERGERVGLAMKARCVSKNANFVMANFSAYDLISTLIFFATYVSFIVFMIMYFIL